MKRLAWLGSLGALVASCASGPVAPAGAPDGSQAHAPSVTERAAAPFDVDAVVRRARLAFRPSGGAFEAAYGAYHARASADALSLTPRTADREGATLRLETVAIGRTGAVVREGDARVGSDGAVEIARGSVRERLESTESGVEQSWRFDSRPAGTGDLVVELRVLGADYLGETDGGLHFGAAGDLGARYGHATWIDARGERTRVRARYVREGTIELAVPSAVVDRAAYPCVLDPLFSPELGMDAPVPALALGEQQSPAVAFDGTGYVVVWTDGRASGLATEIYATRVTTAGSVLDPLGVRLVTTTRVSTTPALGFDGTSFLLAWSTGSFDASDVYGLRFSTALTALDAAPFVISGAANGQYGPALAFDGTSYLVAWTDARGGTTGPVLDVYAARVSPAGVVLDPAGIAISTAPSQQSDPRVDFDGAGFFVAWTDFRAGGLRPEVYATRVSSAGVVLDASGVRLVATAGGGPIAGLGFGIDEHLVAWSATGGAAGAQLHAVRVDRSGNVLDAAPLVLDPEPIGGEASEASVASIAFDGARFVVSWAHDRGPSGGASIYAARVPRAGAPIDEVPIEIYRTSAIDRSYRPAIAFDGAQLFVAWADGRNGTSSDIYASRLTTAGAVLDPTRIAISTAGNGQRTPDVAFDGSSYLVVWADARGGAEANELDVYAVRVDAAGTVLDPSGIAVSTAPNDQTRPRVAFDGTQFLVVWEDRRAERDTGDIYAARVAADGTVLDPDGFAVTSAFSQQLGPTLACVAGSCLVVWYDARTDYFRPGIYAARVSDAGAVLDPDGIPVVDGSVSYGLSTAIVGTDGEGYLVAWADTRVPAASADVYAARVSGSGVVEDLAGILVAGRPGYQVPTSIASDGSRYVVAWETFDGTPSAYDVYVTRVDAGVVLDPAGIAISTAASAQRDARVEFDGTDFVMVWRDQSRDAVMGDVHGALVSPAGALRETFVVSEEPEDETSPAIAAGRPGSLLVAYSRFDYAAPYRVRRVRARVVTTYTPSPLGTECTADGECASGFCVDGVCCDGACGGGITTDCQACSAAAGAASDGTCGPVAAGRTCRAASGTCDVAEACDGASLECPANASRPNLSPCSDGLACNGAEVCMGGACMPGVAPSCDDSDACTEDRCAEPSGCTHTPIPGCRPDAGARDAGAPDAGGGSTGGDGWCSIAGVGAQGGLGILVVVLAIRRRSRVISRTA